MKAFAAPDDEGRKGLEAEIYALIGRFNTARDGALVVPGEYLESWRRKVIALTPIMSGLQGARHRANMTRTAMI